MRGPTRSRPFWMAATRWTPSRREVDRGATIGENVNGAACGLLHKSPAHLYIILRYCPLEQLAMSPLET